MASEAEPCVRKTPLPRKLRKSSPGLGQLGQNRGTARSRAALRRWGAPASGDDTYAARRAGPAVRARSRPTPRTACRKVYAWPFEAPAHSAQADDAPGPEIVDDAERLVVRHVSPAKDGLDRRDAVHQRQNECGEVVHSRRDPIVP
jgi:hypothetical protein